MSATLNFGNVSISAGGGDFSTLPTWSQPGTTAAQGRTALGLGGATTAATAYDGDPVVVELINGGMHYMSIDGPHTLIIPYATLGVDSAENPGGKPTVFLPEEEIAGAKASVETAKWKVTIINQSPVEIQVLRYGSTVSGYPEEPLWITPKGDGNECRILAGATVAFWCSPSIISQIGAPLY